MKMNGTPRSNAVYTNTAITDSDLSIRKDPIPAEETDHEVQEEDPRNFTIPIYKKVKIRIFKPLIPLKLALFVWYGAGSVISTFLIVFFKQRGLTLAELSTIYMITPAVQFIGPTVSGIIADKLGRTKPVLVANLLLTIAIVVGMILAPGLNTISCDPQLVKLKCHSQEFGRLIAKTSCDVHTDVIALSACNVTCPDNVSQHCDGQNLICEMLEGGHENFDNLSLSVHVNWAYKLRNRCYYNVTSMSHKNTTHSWCSVPHKMYCRIQCQMSAEEDCSENKIGRTGVLVLNTTLLVLFFTVFSNTYRFMDVTSMFLVKEFNSDFGRERLFAIIGVLICSPLAGLVVDATTYDDNDKNYDSAMYLFIGMVFLMLAVLYKLEVKIRPPGKNMWRKSLGLLRNFEVISFVLILIVLGTAWGFTKNYVYWYLVGMNAPSFLLGLLSSVSALYGLPFLITSNWWVKKIGTTQIFVLGLLGYVGSCIGYSLLYDPWLALLIEATNIVTYHLLWVAVITYSHSIAPEGLHATVISAVGGIHYSLGKGTGGLIGGQIMSAYGGRVAYRVMALICLTAAVLYTLNLFIKRMCFSRARVQDSRNGAENVVYEIDEPSKESYGMRQKS